jgi:hypothetical protein
MGQEAVIGASLASPFNSALETGVRATVILLSVYPVSLDLQRLVKYDYLIVHSADAGGPPSLHPPLPLRSGELLVRRGLIERGLHLMMSRSLVHRHAGDDGISYAAGDLAAAFLNSLISSYVAQLRERAIWVAAQFGSVSDQELADHW